MRSRANRQVPGSSKGVRLWTRRRGGLPPRFRRPHHRSAAKQLQREGREAQRNPWRRPRSLKRGRRREGSRQGASSRGSDRLLKRTQSLFYPSAQDGELIAPGACPRLAAAWTPFRRQVMPRAALAYGASGLESAGSSRPPVMMWAREAAQTVSRSWSKFDPGRMGKVGSTTGRFLFMSLLLACALRPPSLGSRFRGSSGCRIDTGTC